MSEIQIQCAGKRFLTWSRHLLVLSTWILLFQACAVTQDLLSSLPFAGEAPDSVEKNRFPAGDADEVVGSLAVIRLQRGDTLPDVARHFSLGLNTVSAANPAVDVWVPRPGERLLLPLSFILPEAPRRGVVINLAAMRLFYYPKAGEPPTVTTYPVGIGTAERPTPMGRMRVTRKKHRPTWYVPASIAADHRKKGDPLPPQVPPGPLNPLGEHALYLSKASYLIHGTNKPASVGLRATNGCIRLYPEDVERLFEATPVKTPVRIVYQPYLVGLREGLVYLEAHAPFEDLHSDEEERVRARLKQLEGQGGHRLDWEMVEKILAEGRGVPVAVSAGLTRAQRAAAAPVRLKHPLDLHGRPQVPAMRTDAWYVLAAVMASKVDARRLAAIINHQGPPIPARVLSEGGRHRVLAGPFDDQATAAGAAKRLRIDLALDAIPVAPVQP